MNKFCLRSINRGSYRLKVTSFIRRFACSGRGIARFWSIQPYIRRDLNNSGDYIPCRQLLGLSRNEDLPAL